MKREFLKYWKMSVLSGAFLILATSCARAPITTSEEMIKSIPVPEEAPRVELELPFFNNFVPYPPVEICSQEFGMILFEEGKASLTPEIILSLHRLAQILRMCDDIRLEVQGHTDSTGSERYNIGLANRRARAVTYYLIYDEGIDPARIIRSQKLEQGIWIGEGYGENVPISTNDTEKGRALNRRVHFIILQPNER